MKCPRCDIDLVKKSLRDIEIDECSQCKGIWFDHGELRQAKDSTDKDLRWLDFEILNSHKGVEAKANAIGCPKCNKALVTLEYGDTGVKIDHCPSCEGSWLDKNEFKKIIDSLTDELLSKTFKEYIHESVTEAKEIFTGQESFLSEWKDFAAVYRMMVLRVFAEHPKLMDTMLEIQKINPIK